MYLQLGAYLHTCLGRSQTPPEKVLCPFEPRSTWNACRSLFMPRVLIKGGNETLTDGPALECKTLSDYHAILLRI